MSSGPTDFVYYQALHFSFLEWFATVEYSYEQTTFHANHLPSDNLALKVPIATAADDIWYFYFLGNLRLNISLGDHFYEMSKAVFWEIYEKYFKVSSGEIFTQHAKC